MPSDGTVQVQLTGKELPTFPPMRVDSSLERWYRKVLFVLSRHGIVHIIHQTGELSDMPEKYCIIVNKLFGILVAEDGPLRDDPIMLQQVCDTVGSNPKLMLHGTRLLILFAKGLTFVPITPHLESSAEFMFHKVRQKRLTEKSTLNSVMALLTKLDETARNLDADRWSDQAHEKHLSLILPPGRSSKSRQCWQEGDVAHAAPRQLVE